MATSLFTDYDAFSCMILMYGVFTAIINFW